MAAAAPTTQIASSIAPVFMVLMLLLGGFYVNTDNIPRWCRWVSKLSFVRWSFAALAVNEFDNLSIPCPKGASYCATTGSQVSVSGLGVRVTTPDEHKH